MGSVLVNYYRKKDEKDEHVPKASFSSHNLMFLLILILTRLTLDSLLSWSLKTSLRL